MDFRRRKGRFNYYNSRYTLTYLRKSVIAATQKETGSYYTADQITNYICENTIYPNITDKLNQHFGKTIILLVY